MAGLVKHYQNDMQGIPQLTNAWGCMITLLDAVLVTGFNFRSVLGLSKASAESLTATISLASGHGFIARQVVRIKDSTNGWDGDFKVLSITATSITVECLASHPTTIAGTAQVFTSPLDWEIVFSTTAGSAEPKRAYRSKSPDSLGLILLVHDFCVSGAATTGAKFAKVGLVSSMSDIDTITGTQMPYNAASPNDNWGWDGTYHGWAKWYYNGFTTTNSNAYMVDTSTTNTGNRGFCLVGDDTNGFVFSVMDFANQNGTPVAATYGCVEFFDPTIPSRNIALLCFGVGLKVAQSASLPAFARSAVACFGTASVTGTVDAGNLKGFVWFNTSGIPQQTTLLRPPYLDVTTAAAGDPPPILSDLIILDSAGKARGSVPFLKTTTQIATTSVVDSELGKYRNIYAYQGSSTSSSRVAMLLEKV